MLKKNLLKYRFLLLAILSTGIFTLCYWSIFSSNYERHISSFQDKFSKQEIKLNRFLGYKRKELKENGKLGDWKDLKEHSEFNLHIFVLRIFISHLLGLFIYKMGGITRKCLRKMSTLFVPLF
ncbi:MAG: hypothetical protein RJA13_1256 [Bacteroidota bacterium]